MCLEWVTPSGCFAADPEGGLGDDGPGMDSPDGEDSYHNCPDAEQAFEMFYHEVDDWAQCLANLKLDPDDEDACAEAAEGLEHIIDRLPNPQDLLKRVP